MRWTRRSARALDQRLYGRVSRAYRRRDGAWLLEFRPVSKRGAWRDRVRIWAVLMDHWLIRRLSCYGRRRAGVPYRWAASVACAYRTGRVKPIAAIDPTETVEGLVYAAAADVSELPQTLVSTAAFEEPLSPLPCLVPLRLPCCRLRSLIADAFQEAIVSKDEHAFFCEQWHRWMRGHPELLENPQAVIELRTILLAHVIEFRAGLVERFGGVSPGTTLRRTDRMLARAQRARERLGASRKQRDPIGV